MSLQFKTIQWLPIALKANTRKALQGPALPNGTLSALQLHLKLLSLVLGLLPQGSLTASNVLCSRPLHVLVLSLEYLP